MNQTENGSKGYLTGIVLVAVLGGLLFGYDTAVISGAEKGLQAFFMNTEGFQYTDFWHGFTSSSARERMPGKPEVSRQPQQERLGTAYSEAG